jgi:uncharacterized repeat protein (TIGR03803 family)
LALDATGNLYGTTIGGGGGGLVFELSPGPSGWTETILYTFCSLGKFPVCPDGTEPHAGLTFDKAGNIYGTTVQGGSPKYEGGGVVFKLSPDQSGWKETVLCAFPSAGGRQGGYLLSPVNFDASGNLYSTSSEGGQEEPLGNVFRLSPKNGGTLTTLSFHGTDGATPQAGVLIDPRNGNLYGTTSGEYYDNLGTVFKITGKGLTVLHQFSGQPDGAAPVAGLEADKSGHLYGTTSYGGANNLGTVFEITP